MKIVGECSRFGKVRRCREALVLASLLMVRLVEAFPPAPHHTFFGIVRDEWGNPFSVDDAEVLFQTASGRILSTRIIPGLGHCQNYQLKIPMDSGLTAELHQPTAMRPMMPFTIRVRVGREVFSPIEVSANSQTIGEPGEVTHLDLTLGKDLDGDGIPDAWERSLINRGLADDLAGVNPHGDADGDGLSNLLEYLAGSYAFDNASGFELEIKRFENGNAVMGFLALPGRNYQVLGSTSFDDWEPVSFRLQNDGQGSIERNAYFSDDVREIEFTVPISEPSEGRRFFKLKVK